MIKAERGCSNEQIRMDKENNYNLEYDQMTLKEYVDPFTGEPVKQNK